MNADGTTANGSSLIDEIVREGARRMVAAALEAEVNAYIAELVDQRDDKGHRLVVRNDYHPAAEGDHGGRGSRGEGAAGE